MSDLVERASLAAQEMRDENQNGWPNLVDELAARIEALEAEVAELKSNSITIAGNRSDLHPTATASLLEKNP